jgi:WD40 repeat protein
VSYVTDRLSWAKSSRLRSVLVMEDENTNNLTIYSICFSPKCKYLATGGQDGRIQVRLSPL